MQIKNMFEEIRTQAPGRINLIGEHTDYNGGFVLPAAIDKNTKVLIKLNGTEQVVNARSLNYNESFTFQLSNFNRLESGWQNYVMGVVAEVQKLNNTITGFDLEFEGNIPIGSGMSSSAALECSLAYALNELFELNLSKIQLIEASQLAEHNFVGTRCGIMDQFTSVMGKKDHAILLDCSTMEHKYFPLKLNEYEILLLNTNVSHNLATSEYNTRRQECELGLEILSKTYANCFSFRDFTIDQLNDSRQLMTETVYQRCRHVLTENNRVLSATQALVDGKIHILGRLMYQSHQSLQYDYNVSCAELDYLVSQTIGKDYILGSRMMGGGFGGCTISLIDKNKTEAFIVEIKKAYLSKFNIELIPYRVSIDDGARVI